MKQLIIIAILLMVALPAHAKKSLAQRAHEAVSKVCPINGISLEDSKVKTTWRVDFKSTATAAQKAAAQQAVKDFSLTAPDAEQVAKDKAFKRLEKAAEGTDNTELINALKGALKTDAIEPPK